MDLNRRMDVHDVARTDQARIVEVPRLEEQWIEGSEVASAGRFVVELRFPFPGRPCNERVYLRTASRRDELSAVELERNVRRLSRRDQSARAIRHLEPSATEHDVSRP